MSYFGTPKIEVTRPADDDEAAALKGDVTPGETKDCGAPDCGRCGAYSTC